MTLFAVISREMCRMVRQPLYWFCLVAAPEASSDMVRMSR